MQHIASYPLSENVLTSHIGSPVMGVTVHGDSFCGILQSCGDGQVYIAPLQGAQTSQVKVKRLKDEFSKHPNVKKFKQKSKKIASSEKAEISFLGPGFGYGFGLGPGIGFGSGFGFGLGAGIGFALPLLAIGALFAFPFF